ncbi:hypothetical protein NQ317_009424 [Molorchus minor]|uniref:Antistasin-like domain-containing protein n=1 Tax=Molorchus minor TaxID=1323400 RepID=A0ABQ9J8Q0_9CUCU|nr:hypothetical protein NQ317_009424 [Molorchus minor]
MKVAVRRRSANRVRPIVSQPTWIVAKSKIFCVCLPCKTECGNNRTVEIIRRGTNFPGSCCDLYECKKVDEMKGCNVDNIFYSNGEEWVNQESQSCKCQNGLSLCSNTIEEKSQSCFKDDKIYKHLENWTREDGCTYCTCINGEEKCISHFCEVKESKIQKNDSEPILKGRDDCTYCTCTNGEEKCTDEMCDKTPTINKKTECQPLSNCNKTCVNGFKINKKGCEICKCTSVRFTQDILGKYNITMKDLIVILDNYANRRAATTTTTTTTTTISSISDPVTVVPPASINIITNMFTEDLSSTTTEPSIVPADESTNYWTIALPILVLLSVGCVALVVLIVICIYKNRRKSSLDLSHCHYETVNNLNNNNTIKKTDQLL